MVSFKQLQDAAAKLGYESKGYQISRKLLNKLNSGSSKDRKRSAISSFCHSYKSSRGFYNSFRPKLWKVYQQ